MRVNMKIQQRARAKIFSRGRWHCNQSNIVPLVSQLSARDELRDELDDWHKNRILKQDHKMIAKVNFHALI